MYNRDMFKKPYQSINSILSKDSNKVSKIAQNSKKLGIIKSIISNSIDTIAPNSFEVTGINPSSIKLSCANSSVATRLRLLSEHIIKALQLYPQFSHIIHIQCNIAKAKAQKNAPEKRVKIPNNLSPSTRSKLSKLADSLEESGLKDAIKKLTSE